MALEDFFTLTEMRKGLASQDRVEELINVMQKHNDCVMSNVGDAARQLSIVAGTIAATEDKHCVTHFVHLNGHCFLNQWLQKALNHWNDISDVNVEDFLNSVLWSLERLPMDWEKITSSGILLTAEQLQAHKNSNIKERAMILFRKWNDARSDEKYQITETDGLCLVGQSNSLADADTIMVAQSTYSVSDSSPCTEGAKAESCVIEYVGTDSHHSNITGCDRSQSDMSIDAKVSISNQIMPATSSDSFGGTALSGGVDTFHSSRVSNSFQNCSVIEFPSAYSAVKLAFSNATSSSIAKKIVLDDKHDALAFKDVDGVKTMVLELDMKDGALSKSSHNETSNIFPASLPEQKPAGECNLLWNFDSEESKASSSKTIEPQPSMGINCELSNLGNQKELKSPMHSINNSQGLSRVQCMLRKKDNPGSSFYTNGARGSANGAGELGNEVDMKLKKEMHVIAHSSSTKPLETKLTGLLDKNPELVLQFEEIDELEVVRQVAIEVKHEVVDYIEPFCSSLSLSPREGTGSKCSGFVEDKQDQLVTKELNSKISPCCEDLPCTASPKEENSKLSEAPHADTRTCVQVMELQHPAVTQVSNSKTESNRFNFDLNEDASPEEFDCLVNHVSKTAKNLSVPIAVSASRGTLVLPIIPLQFGGQLGWKGSAATSAFYPPSFRGTSVGERTGSGSKKANLLRIDLNVSGSEEDVVIDPVFVKKVLVSSGFASVDSSVEVSLERAERLMFDLNHTGEEDLPAEPSSFYKLRQSNEDNSFSSASSSPSMRGFDLNEIPSFPGRGHDSCNLRESSPKVSSTHGSSKYDDSVITNVVSKMAADEDRASLVQQSFLGSGLHRESAIPKQTYNHTFRAYEYHAIPPGTTVHLPPTLYHYGGIPYMVDSGRAMPHILGPAGLSAAQQGTLPLHMSLASTQSSLNVASHSISGINLNHGMVPVPVPVESGSREVGWHSQLLMQRHYGLMGGNDMAGILPVASGMTLKRKEPDTGCDPYTYDFIGR